MTSSHQLTANFDNELSFIQFLENFKNSVKRAFHEIDNIDVFSGTRGFPQAVLDEIKSANPFSLVIPKKYGGFGANVKQNIAMISAASYESLALSLTLGINNALFVQPFSKYGQESFKQKVFERFVKNHALGGLMITEPEFGSDALNMQTSVTLKGNKYHFEGKKHWQGLTGMADFWLLTGRRKSENGNLMRDIEMFVSDNSVPNQKIVVEEYFQNLGLYQIPYGLNKLDVLLPEDQRLIPHSTGVKMMLDLLHRSRFQFPAMGLGFIKRLLDEAIEHTKTRLVGGKPLLTYDQVQQRLSRMQANFTICSAFCHKSSQVADIENDLSPLGLEANMIKSITSDMMQESAQNLLQLVGAKGYKLNNIAGSAVVDSRPFQIFEGSNDILYQQITESVIKTMKSIKEFNLSKFIKDFTPRAFDFVKKMLDLDVNIQMSQRNSVIFGQLISRIYAIELVSQLKEKTFNNDLADNSIELLSFDVTTLLSQYNSNNSTKVIIDYQESSYWYDK